MNEVSRLKFSSHLNKHFREGRLSLADKMEFEHQYFLLEQNYNKLKYLYPGMWVAYAGGKEYVAQFEADLNLKLLRDDPLRERKVFSIKLSNEIENYAA